MEKGAPKRAMSPFLFFSNEKRGQIQTENPSMKITEVSVKLGEIWRDMTEEEKEPYMQKSREDRDRYHAQQDEFKGKNSQQATVRAEPECDVDKADEQHFRADEPGYFWKSVEFASAGEFEYLDVPEDLWNVSTELFLYEYFHSHGV